MVAASKVKGYRPTASAIVAEGYKDQHPEKHLDHVNGPSSTNHGRITNSKGLPLSIVKAAIQAAIKDIEQEEARKNQDFQDWEARRMMRREVKDKARRQDTPHHGRVSQSQAGQTHARRDENANFSRGKKRGPGSDVTMQSQYTKRAKYMCEPDEMNALVFRDDDDSAQLVDASAKAVKSSSLCGTESDDSTLSL